MNTARISIKEKFSYGLGDTGCNLVWQTVMLFMAWFYTDVFGLSPAHMGTMFLAVRVLDAVTDVLMGAVADRTRTKYGQFRPYILWFAIPFGVLCCLTFYTPQDIVSINKSRHVCQRFLNNYLNYPLNTISMLQVSAEVEAQQALAETALEPVLA